MGSPGVGEEAFAVGQVRFRHSRLPLDSFTMILAVRRAVAHGCAGGTGEGFGSGRLRLDEGWERLGQERHRRDTCPLDPVSPVSSRFENMCCCCLLRRCARGAFEMFQLNSPWMRPAKTRTRAAKPTM